MNRVVIANGAVVMDKVISAHAQDPSVEAVRSETLVLGDTLQLLVRHNITDVIHFCTTNTLNPCRHHFTLGTITPTKNIEEMYIVAEHQWH